MLNNKQKLQNIHLKIHNTNTAHTLHIFKNGLIEISHETSYVKFLV